MTAWFTSDHHFNHEKAIEYCGRPFLSLDNMHERMIELWNSVVKPGDIVYHLGDFALTWRGRDGIDDPDRYLLRLNGNKQLIRGNHDRDATVKSKRWSWVGDYKRIKISGQAIVLFHYPIRSWHGMHKSVPAWCLHGHSHGNLTDHGGKILDVGVDCHGFLPLSFEQVMDYMKTREVVVCDHHEV